MRMFVSWFDKVVSDFMIAIKFLLTSSTLFYLFYFDLNRFKRFKSVEFYENICKLFWQE